MAQRYFTWELLCFGKDGYLGGCIMCETYANAVWVARRWLRQQYRSQSAAGEYRPLVKLSHIPTRSYHGKCYLPNGWSLKEESSYTLFAYTAGELVQRVTFDSICPTIHIARSWTQEQSGNTYRIRPKHKLFKLASGMPMYFRYPASSSSTIRFG